MKVKDLFEIDRSRSEYAANVGLERGSRTNKEHEHRQTVERLRRQKEYRRTHKPKNKAVKSGFLGSLFGK